MDARIATDMIAYQRGRDHKLKMDAFGGFSESCVFLEIACGGKNEDLDDADAIAWRT